MAGTVTVTTSRDRGLTKYSCACVSDAAGVVSVTTVAVRSGQIVQVIITPDGGGTAPTDLYDCTLTLGGGGTDLLGGGGANCSGTLPVVVGNDLTNLPLWVPSGNLIPVAAAVGNAKGFTMDIYIAG